MSSTQHSDGIFSIDNPIAYKNRMSKPYKIINGFLNTVAVVAFIFIMFFTTFYKINIKTWEYFALSISLILMILFYIMQSAMAIVNDKYYIPKLKKDVKRLPKVGLQIIGRNQSPEIFTSVLSKIKNLSYPKQLIQKIVLCVDGDDTNENKQMIKIFKQMFPFTYQINLKQHFSKLSLQQQIALFNQYRYAKHLVISQPHGGRRETKYTAFSFSSLGTEYVFHCDSDTIVNSVSLESMCRTAAGYNEKTGKRCGGVVGQVRICNVVTYFALQMEISYWYAFNTGRASQSLFGCVTTISGAMGLFDSTLIKDIIQQYVRQKFLHVKCVYGEDRHLTSGLIQRQTAVLYDDQATAETQSPTAVHALIIQQTLWFKGFYRQTLVFLPHIFEYDFWSVLVIGVSFFAPFLVMINIFGIVILDINRIALYIIYVFVATFLLCFRAFLRNRQFKIFHALWHPLFFVLFLLPSKIWSLLTTILCIPDIQFKQRWKQLIHVYSFILVAGSVFITIGVLYNFIKHQQKVKPIYNYILIGVGASLVFLACHWIIWGWHFYIPNNLQKMKKIYTRIQINSVSSGKILVDGSEQKLTTGSST